MICVQNIYYMLSYAFQVLNEQGYKQVLTEEFKKGAGRRQKYTYVLSAVFDKSACKFIDLVYFPDVQIPGVCFSFY